MADNWDDAELAEVPGRRPADVTLAVKLLGGSVAFHLFAIFKFWSRIGLSAVSAYPAAWIRQGVLGISAIMIVLVWHGSSWARNLVVLAITADVLRILMGAGLVLAVAGSRWLGLLSWEP